MHPGAKSEDPAVPPENSLPSGWRALPISVVICAYTEARWKTLAAAVASVRGNSLTPYEIILVSDGNPALLERARRELPVDQAVANTGPPGLGGARNSGVKAASGDIVAFLDDDAAAEPDWLAELAEGYRDPQVAGVGGAILPLWQAGRPAWFPEEFDWAVGCTYKGMPEQAAPVRNLIGCNMSFRREAFERAGDFRLGYGCDETEFCIRLLKRTPEMSLLYQPAARVHHRVPPERGSWRHFRRRCIFEGGSKAVVAYLQGGGAGLASERAYTFTTLPRGVLRGLAEAFSGSGLAGAARAGTIVAGLLFTTAGYLAGRLNLEGAARARGYQGPPI